MSDDESFVILGTSPPSPSIVAPPKYSDVIKSNNSLRLSQMQASNVSSASGNKSLTTSSDQKKNSIQKSSQMKAANSSLRLSQMQASNVSRAGGNKSLTGSDRKENSIQPEMVECVPTPSPRKVQTVTTNGNENVMANSNIFTSNTAGNGQKSASICTDTNTAASLILGEISADVLKSPSLSMEACSEDVVKFENLMKKYVDLTNTLTKADCTMKKFLDQTKVNKQNHKQELEKRTTQIASLQHEVNEKNDQIKIHKSGYDKLLQALSEKTAQLNNMLEQTWDLENLEQQQLGSCQYLPKKENDSKEKSDYVDTLEHQIICKEFERKLSEVVAENYDLKDVQKQYVDEINLLTVKLVAAEKLIKQSRADIDLLKAKNMEKDQLLQDFRAMQRKNQELRTKKEADIESKRRTSDQTITLQIAAAAAAETAQKQYVDEINLLTVKLVAAEKLIKQSRADIDLLKAKNMEKDQLLQDFRAMQRKNQELRTKKEADIESKRRTSDQTITLQIAAAAAAETAAPALAKKNCCPVCKKTFTSLSSLQDHVNNCFDKAK